MIRTDASEVVRLKMQVAIASAAFLGDPAGVKFMTAVLTALVGEQRDSGIIKKLADGALR
jgi:hypothetical protein